MVANRAGLVLLGPLALMALIFQLLENHIYLAATQDSIFSPTTECSEITSHCYTYNCSSIYEAVRHTNGTEFIDRFSNWFFYWEQYWKDPQMHGGLFSLIATCFLIPGLLGVYLANLFHKSLFGMQVVIWLLYAACIGGFVIYIVKTRRLECLTYWDTRIANEVKISIGLTALIFCYLAYASEPSLKTEDELTISKLDKFSKFQGEMAWVWSVNILDGTELLDSLVPRLPDTDEFENSNNKDVLLVYSNLTMGLILSIWFYPVITAAISLATMHLAGKAVISNQKSSTKGWVPTFKKKMAVFKLINHALLLIFELSIIAMRSWLAWSENETISVLYFHNLALAVWTFIQFYNDIKDWRFKVVPAPQAAAKLVPAAGDVVQEQQVPYRRQRPAQGI